MLCSTRISPLFVNSDASMNIVNIRSHLNELKHLLLMKYNV